MRRNLWMFRIVKNGKLVYSPGSLGFDTSFRETFA